MGRRLADALFFSAFLKIFTFGLSALLTRSLLPEQKGVAFTLDLYADTLVFVAREAVRSTSSRVSLHIGSAEDVAKAKGDALAVYATQRIVNMSAWCIPLTFAMIAMFEGLYLSGVTLVPSLTHIQGIATTVDTGSLAVAVFVSGILLQMCAEPKQAIFRSLLLFRQKIAVEAVGLGCRLAVALVLIRFGVVVEPVLSFALAHLAYGLATLVYTEAAWGVFPAWVGAEFVALKHILRRNALLCIAERSDIQNHSKAIRRAAFPLSFGGMAKEAKINAGMWRSFFLDSILRILLTEGEKFFLAAFGTMSSQGIYDMVMNLGSLVVRVVFRVWEDNCSSTWAQLQAQNAYDKALLLLQRMIKIALILGGSFFLFGPPLSRLLLQLLYGSRWTSHDAVQALQEFCVLVPLMGVNGLLEAFIRATGSPSDLRFAWAAMLVSSVLYTGSCYFQLVVSTHGDGATRLIRANILNTAIRCVLSALVIIRSAQFTFHWRSSSSTAADTDAKPTMIGAGEKSWLGQIDLALVAGIGLLYAASRTIGSNTDRLHLLSGIYLTHGHVTTLLALVPLFVGLVIWRDGDVRGFLVELLSKRRRKASHHQE